MSHIESQIAGAWARFQSGARDEALAALDALVGAEPAHAAALEARARMLTFAARWPEAARDLERATAADPTNAHLHFALGCVRSQLRDTPGQIAAFSRAVELAPEWAEARVPLGHILGESGQTGAGERHLRRALELAPRSAAVARALAGALTTRGRAEEAIEVLRAGMASNPADTALLAQLCHTLNYVEGAPAGAARAFRTQYGRVLGCGPRLRPGRTPHVPDARRRLRIGYLSADLRSHPVPRFLEQALIHHDRGGFEIFCYHTGPEDETTGRLRGHPLTWRHVQQSSDADLLGIIRGDLIDVLVELSGHTGGNRHAVLVHRAAPVQATYIGSPSSTGVAAIDYRIVDAITDPPGAESEASEVLVRLPGCFLCYGPPADAPPPAARTGDPLTFGSFNNLAKVSPATVALWSRLLGEVPGSRLFLKAKGLGDEDVRADILARFRQAGIDGSRLELRGETPEAGAHLACYGDVDIALDTSPYNGATTTCEALWMGVPVITVRGRLHAGRVGASLLTAVGLADLIAESADAFVSIAAALASDRARLGALRATLRDRVGASALCDGAGHTRALEGAYRRMWAAWCSA